MPELKCTVQTCKHNQNYNCDLDKITVGGVTPQLHRRTLVATVLKNVKTDIQTAQENRHRQSAR